MGLSKLFRKVLPKNDSMIARTPMDFYAKRRQVLTGRPPSSGGGILGTVFRNLRPAQTMKQNVDSRLAELRQMQSRQPTSYGGIESFMSSLPRRPVFQPFVEPQPQPEGQPSDPATMPMNSMQPMNPAQSFINQSVAGAPMNAPVSQETINQGIASMLPDFLQDPQNMQNFIRGLRLPI